MSLSKKTPEFNGSMQYIEICGDLMKSFHNAMVGKQYNLSISILQQLHSEILPWMDKDQVTKCSKFEKKCVNQLSGENGRRDSINVSSINNWFRKLNIIFHETGLGMKSNKVDDDEWVV